MNTWQFKKKEDAAAGPVSVDDPGGHDAERSQTQDDKHRRVPPGVPRVVRVTDRKWSGRHQGLGSGMG